MVFNLNIVNLTITITSLNKIIFYIKYFIIILLTYLQFYHVWNSSDKNYSFHGILSVQQN